jgi:hypothetical protein
MRNSCTQLAFCLFLVVAFVCNVGIRETAAWVQPTFSKGISTKRSDAIGHKWAKAKQPTPRPLETQDVSTLLWAAKGERLLRVVTDIDDTVKSSGNKRLAGIPLGGIDAQYERGEFYPGVFQFALELAAHGTPRGQPPLPVAVLTARAKEFLFALELKREHPVSVAYRYLTLAHAACCSCCASSSS